MKFVRIASLVALVSCGTALVLAAKSTQQTQFAPLSAEELATSVGACDGNVPLQGDYCPRAPKDCPQNYTQVLGVPVPDGCVSLQYDSGCNLESGDVLGDDDDDGSDLSTVQCSASFTYCTCWVDIVGFCHYGTFFTGTCGTKKNAVDAC